ncbi:hypothetical protein C7999DRAFT_28954 [Corynascus novoguineensis]|uniref:DUF8035 domain-containing protein n=1 Tax=Corynascus novoguineensis TaxID=1126955 RepID=A0AAN7CY84_9PEZI|nr:hypothetical protein C7999DRAFT_28954 [Corynascus novoguineensis]
MTRPEDSPSIESVGAFARQLYRRARDAGTDFVDLAIAIRNLRTALKDLEAEAQDHDSPLYAQTNPAANSETQNSVYGRQLWSLVEDSDFALKQVSTILQKYGDIPSSSTARRNADRGEIARKVDLIRGDVISQSMKIDIFLDTVQLHSVAKPRPALENVDDQQMDGIKNKVDTIANRIFRERENRSPSEGDEEELWRSFKRELEREGFSAQVLQEHKEVLRAYIRELESHQPPSGGSPPSVRGLLHWDEKLPMTAPPAPYPVHDGELMANSNPGALSNEGRRRVPMSEHSDSMLLSSESRSPALPQLSFEQSTSSEQSDAESSPSASTALISTRDLMALDRYCSGKVATFTNVGTSLLPPTRAPFYFISPGTSPDTRYFSPGTQQLPIPGAVAPGHDGQPVALPPPYSSASTPGPPPPPYGSSLTATPSDAVWDLATLSSSAPTSGHDMQGQYPPQRQYSRLAPDSKGQTIPLDATWTKIDRRLVSPEVLEKAGVRYEARPSFVAVLGILTREQIEEFARKSFEVRRARTLPAKARSGNAERQQTGVRQETYGDYYRKRGVGESRGGDRESVTRDHGSEALFDASDSDGDDSNNDRRRETGQVRHRGRYTPKDYIPSESKHLDSEDEGKGAKAHPIIVSPPTSVDGDDVSPSSTVLPKPILKNKNPNHVRFDRNGPREISPGQYSERRRDREYERDRDRPRRDKSRERSRNRSKVTDRDRDRDRDKDLDHRSASKRYSDRDRDRDRDRDQPRRGEEDRPSRRAALKDAAGAIGVSGAAATLLSVLTQAVTHL